MVTGIIYKIECCITGEVYYGSTTQKYLSMRMAEHKSGCKRWKEGKTTYTTSYSIIERGYYSYNVIENVECENKHQLHTRERYYIENNECINKFIPARTHREYNEKYQKTYAKAYYQTNKEHINKLNRLRYAENKTKTI